MFLFQHLANIWLGSICNIPLYVLASFCRKKKIIHRQRWTQSNCVNKINIYYLTSSNFPLVLHHAKIPMPETGILILFPSLIFQILYNTALPISRETGILLSQANWMVEMHKQIWYSNSESVWISCLHCLWNKGPQTGFLIWVPCITH